MNTLHETDRDPEIVSAAEPMRLRHSPPPVTRLSRRVLIAGAAAGAVAIAAAVGWGLLGRTASSAPDGPFSINPLPPAKITELPKDYGAMRQAPRLGPPLPGDLGRPMLESAYAASSGPSSSAAGPPTAEDQIRLAQIQRLAQERDAARTSRLFGTGGGGQTDAPVPRAVPFSAGPLPAAAEPSAQAAAPGSGLLEAPVDRRMVSPDRLAPAPSPYALQAGAVVPVALVTGIRSDLPGQVIGQVTQDVYDSVSGRFLLIPAGARLIGRYDSRVAFGQNRVLLAWTRLLLPNGRSVVLENLPGADAGGFAGLEDKVDHHWRELLGAAAVSSLLGVGTQVTSTGDAHDLASALRRAGADSANQVGQQIVGKSLSIPPTLTIGAGVPVRVILTRDLVLEPYRG